MTYRHEKVSGNEFVNVFVVLFNIQIEGSI